MISILTVLNSNLETLLGCGSRLKKYSSFLSAFRLSSFCLVSECVLVGVSHILRFCFMVTSVLLYPQTRAVSPVK